MLLAAAFDVARLLPLLLMIVATGTLMLRLRNSRRKHQSPVTPVRLAPAVAHGSSDAMRREVEFYDLAREAQARLDDKIAMLQQLLIEADERIARLSELESQRLHIGTHREVESSMATDSSSVADPYARDTARYAVVFGMSDAGHNPMSIARRLSLPLGEIELMLSLRRRLPERPAA